ncbi:hypothetical protein HK097_001763, partial [Rhizophlyctis rosea]
MSLSGGVAMVPEGWDLGRDSAEGYQGEVESPRVKVLKRVRRRRERLGKLAWFAELALNGVELPSGEALERYQNGNVEGADNGNGVGGDNEDAQTEVVVVDEVREPEEPVTTNLFDALVEVAKNAGAVETADGEDVNETLVSLVRTGFGTKRNRITSAAAMRRASTSSPTEFM